MNAPVIIKICNVVSNQEAMVGVFADALKATFGDYKTSK